MDIEQLAVLALQVAIIGTIILYLLVSALVGSPDVAWRRRRANSAAAA
jgi:hypothetical protein